jgi:hypothetical protein
LFGDCQITSLAPCIGESVFSARLAGSLREFFDYVKHDVRKITIRGQVRRIEAAAFVLQRATVN